MSSTSLERPWKVLHVAGARPNFMKVAPVYSALEGRRGVEQVLVHTGQHFDREMSEIFFEQLGLPAPDVNLEISGGSHSQQVGRMICAFEPLLDQYRPDIVIVVGDVNSSLACGLVAAQHGIPVAHIEAGLRSRDRSMQEEINRVLIDHFASLHFAHCREAVSNLVDEGIDPDRIHLVGNTMIDSLVRILPLAEARRVPDIVGRDLDHFVLVTLHRPFNVDDRDHLAEIVAALGDVAQEIPVVFPVHPRTRARLAELSVAENLILLPPLGYIDFVALEKRAEAVVTDSGGVQEETTFLGVPCVTVRPNTERPITIDEGTNMLCAVEREAIQSALRAQKKRGRQTLQIEFWDGFAGVRVADVLCGAAT